MPPASIHKRTWKQLAFTSRSGRTLRTSDIVLRVVAVALLAGFCLIMAADVIDGVSTVPG
ncbi:hypothetical protein FV219_00105 [Methylobacterium sp. WL122]|nr:hypothetical protein FV219_00105 [Methylobacterium sp. WL122]